MATPEWQRLRRGFAIDRGLTNNTVNELWVCRNLDTNRTDVETIINTCPPIIGTVYQDLGFTTGGQPICIRKSLVYGPRRRQIGVDNTSMVLVNVRYESNPIRYGLRYKSRTIGWGSRGVDLYVPQVVRTFSSLTAFTWSLKNMIRWGTRSEILRTVTIIRPGDPDLIAFNCLGQLDRLFAYDPSTGLLPPPGWTSPSPTIIPAVFRNFEIRDLQTGNLEVRYHFFITPPVREIEKEWIGSDVNVPALGYLDEWIPVMTPNDPMPIRVLKAQERYREGDGLP